MTCQYTNLSTEIKETWRKAIDLKEPVLEGCPNVHIYKFSMTWPMPHSCEKSGIVTVATKPDDLSSVPRAHTEEGQNRLPLESFSDLTHPYPTGTDK